MSRARLNGIEIDYEVSGSGPPVLLSHGYSATRRMRRSETAGPSSEISSTPTLLPSCPRCSCASTERSRCDAEEVSVSSPRTTST